MTAAEALFLESSFTTTSVRKVAEQTGSPGSSAQTSQLLCTLEEHGMSTSPATESAAAIYFAYLGALLAWSDGALVAHGPARPGSAVDAAIYLRPPKFIRNYLDGVRFPRDRRWALVFIKFLSVAGLMAEILVQGITFAANLAVAPTP